MIALSVPVTLHALGNATSRAVDVAQFLVAESFGELTLSATTSTETLIDDYILIPTAHNLTSDPNKMDIEGTRTPLPKHLAQVRHVSAIHITISHTNSAPKRKIPKVSLPSE